MGIALDHLAQVGDRLRLVWPSANGFSEASVESWMLGLGLVVEVAPERAQKEYTVNNGKRMVLVLVLVAVLALLAGQALADGPVIWKQHCPRHYDVVLMPAGDWDGVHVLCVRAAEAVGAETY